MLRGIATLICPRDSSMKIAALALAAALLPAPLMAQSGLSRLFDQPAGNSPAAGNLLFARDAQSVAGALRELGYRAEMSTDSAGDPLIRSSEGGINFSIFFYGCQKPDGCDSVQFYTALDLRDGMTFQQVNEWSTSKRFARVYLDDEMDPAIEMDVLMPFGMTKETFADHVRLWGLVLDQFKDHVNW